MIMLNSGPKKHRMGGPKNVYDGWRQAHILSAKIQCKTLQQPIFFSNLRKKRCSFVKWKIRFLHHREIFELCDRASACFFYVGLMVFTPYQDGIQFWQKKKSKGRVFMYLQGLTFKFTDWLLLNYSKQIGNFEC